VQVQITKQTITRRGDQGWPRLQASGYRLAHHDGRDGSSPRPRPSLREPVRMVAQRQDGRYRSVGALGNEGEVTECERVMHQVSRSPPWRNLAATLFAALARAIREPVQQVVTGTMLTRTPSGGWNAWRGGSAIRLRFHDQCKRQRWTRDGSSWAGWGEASRQSYADIDGSSVC
jgi:hypothetical protein